MNQAQPQTLQIAVFLMYLDAVFLAVFGGIFSIFGLLFIAGYVGAGYGIANERKWGYWLGVGIAGLFLLISLLPLAFGLSIFALSAAGLLFAVAKFALLVHPMSWGYQRTWFR